MEARCWSTGHSQTRRPGLRVPDGGTEIRVGRPQTGPARVPIWPPDRTTGATPLGEISHRRRRHGGNVVRRQRGGIMDNVERSFAAATAAGFVVLVIGLVLLALL